MSNINKNEPIPEVAQKTIFKLVKFFVNKMSLLLLLTLVPVTIFIVTDYEQLFTERIIFPLLLVAFLVFYFRFRKSFLLKFEKDLKNKRFDLSEYKTIKIGSKKEASEKNWEK